MQSMENLLFMSASTLEKSDDIIGLSSLKVSFSFNAFPSQLWKYSYQRLGQSSNF